MEPNGGVEPAATVQGKVTGIIYPPPDIRAIVDKTAQFVARNGRSFERKIAGDTASERFSFLRAVDPYNAYYEHKVTWFTEQHNATTIKETTSTGNDNLHTNGDTETVEKPQSANDDATKPDSDTIVVEKKAVEDATAKVVKKIRESSLTPPEEEKFIIKHPQLSALDQEIMYLTAQYTALSGKTFLAGLATREQRNPQFDFLKPTHALFAYFTALVESYAQVLSKNETQMRTIEEGMDRMKVLDRSVYKLEWMRQEQEKKDREAAESDAERQALSQIDWHDFIVVETITFNEAEEEAAALAAAAAANAHAAGSDGEDMDMEEDSEDEDDKASKANIKVVQDYVPLSVGAGSSSNSAQQPSLLSVDGKAVSLADANEHMRILLMDPKWREERQRHLEKQKETSYAAGTAISDSLKRFATKRADIFASSAEEAARLKQSRDAPAPGQQKSAMEDERDDYHDDEDEVRGELEQSMGQAELVDPSSHVVPPGTDYPPGNAMMGMGAPGMMPPHFQGAPPGTFGFPGMVPPTGMFPPVVPGGIPSAPGMMPPGSVPPGFMAPPPGIAGPPGIGATPLGLSDESATKRQRLDGPAPLLTEAEFAALNPGAVRMNIRIPKDEENAQWNMNGQTITVEVDVKDTMRVLKEKLMKELGNIPINKFQLKAPVGFVKDTLSCAHYNFVNGTTLELSVRQRGGRR